MYLFTFDIENECYNYMYLFTFDIENPVKYLYGVFRPTATELLKHPFFKKAREKDFLVHAIIEKGPTFASRAKRVWLVLYMKICDCVWRAVCSKI